MNILAPHIITDITEDRERWNKRVKSPGVTRTNRLVNDEPSNDDNTGRRRRRPGLGDPLFNNDDQQSYASLSVCSDGALLSRRRAASINQGTLTADATSSVVSSPKIPRTKKKNSRSTTVYARVMARPRPPFRRYTSEPRASNFSTQQCEQGSLLEDFPTIPRRRT